MRVQRGAAESRRLRARNRMSKATSDTTWFSREVGRRRQSSVPQLGAPTNDVLAELVANGVVEWRRLVLGEGLLVDVGRAGGRVLGPAARPPPAVLGRRQEGSVEAVTKARHRVLGAEEVTPVAHFEMGVEGERRLVDLHGGELHAQHPQQLNVDDEL